MNPQSRGGKIAKSKLIADTRNLFASSVRNRLDTCSHGYKITLTRVSVKLLDDDNVQGALKPVRDGVADGLGLASDRQSDKLSWDYQQARGPMGYYGVRVRIEAKDANERTRTD